LRVKNYFANLNYQFNKKTSLHFDYTLFYLAQQAGGLTDECSTKIQDKVTALETGLQLIGTYLHYV
jgi:hypothetical protein